MVYLPNRGDIVTLDCKTGTNEEKQKCHFALVMSPRVFNIKGLVMVCPIYQGKDAAVHTYGTVVSLIDAETKTQGAIYCHQLMSLDRHSHNVQLVERVPIHVINEASARLNALLSESPQ